MAKYPGLLVTQADKEQALYKGLLGMGQQMSQGYTSSPTSFMQGLGQGGAGFQKGYGDQIALTKENQLQQMQAQSQQAQMEAQQMKIAEQKRLNEEREAMQASAQAYAATRLGGDADFGQPGGAPGGQQAPMDALTRHQLETNPAAYMQSQVDAKASADAATLAYQRDMAKERLKNSGEGALKPKDVISLERDLSKNVQNEMGPQIERVRGYGQMEAIFADPAKAGGALSGQSVTIDGKVFDSKGQGAADMALIFSFMKMNDPSSVVRESEFDMAASTSGMAQGLKNTIGKVMAGDRLSAGERKSLMRQARNQYGAAEKELKARIKQEKARFGQYNYKGLNAERALSSVYTPYNPMFESNAFAPQAPVGGGRGTIIPTSTGQLPSDLVPVGR